VKTILYGPVTKAHLADAALFAGIEPTEFVTGGTPTPPFSQRPTTVIPVDPMVHGEAGERQQHWRMAINADALVCVGQNDHLVHAANSFKLPVYQTDV
jgi:hypothetical protein